MWLSRFWVLLGIVGVMAGCGGEPVAPEPVEPTPGLTAFVGARIIDGTGNAAIENGVLVDPTLGIVGRDHRRHGAMSIHVSFIQDGPLCS